MKFYVLLCFLSFAWFGCVRQQNNLAVGSVTFKEMKTHCSKGGEPNLYSGENGALYLSWLEYDSDTTFSFRYSTLQESGWSEERIISSGSNWFVNWADFPSIASYKGQTPSLVGHWLEMSDDGTYDYDIKITQSHDGGNTWNRAFKPHTDGIPAEHGFVSMIPLSEERMFATWLDGRNTKSHDASGDNHGHGTGPMTLRGVVFDKEGRLYDEVELDDRVCDCCQTSAAVVNDGIIVAYRNRTEGEIRDIAVVRKKGNRWFPPKIVHNDNWMFPGCPVNGPMIKSLDSTVAISWFAMNDTIPEVKVAFSFDSGENFEKPIRIDQGDPLGRVDLVFLSSKLVVASWLERTNDGAIVLARKIYSDGSVGEVIEVVKTSSARGSGFPRMEKSGNKLIFAWTHIDSVSRIRTLEMTI